MRALLIASIVVALTGPCCADDLSPSDIGVGLNKLKWGMTQAQVRAVYPTLTAGIYAPLRIPHYAYTGCDFEVYPEFTNDKLDSLSLETYDPSPCYLGIKAELLSQYGKPDPTESRDDGTRLFWKTPHTLVWYIGGESLLHIAFEQSEGSPHHPFIDDLLPPD